MKRLLQHLAAMVSLVACAGVVVVWVRARATLDQVTGSGADHEWLIINRPQGLYVGRLRYDPPPPNRGWPWASGPVTQPKRGWAWVSRPVTQRDRAALREYGSILGFRAGRLSGGSKPGRYITRPGSHTPEPGFTVRFASLPHWFFAALFLVPPAAAGLRFLRRRSRRRGGRCLDCGYDLRVTPQRCPECGAVPPGAGGAGRGASGNGLGEGESCGAGSSTPQG